MKFKHILSIAFVCLAYLGLYSQNHSTVDSLEVTYKFPSTPNIESASPEIKGFPLAKIVLKTLNNISKVHFKIKNAVTNELIYEVNYNLSSPKISSGNELVLFERNHLTVSIGSPNLIPLQTYLCEVITEDNQGHLSDIFSKIQ